MAVHENLLHVTKYEVLGKLPDLLTFEDGTPVKTPDDWQMRRGEILAVPSDLCGGAFHFFAGSSRKRMNLVRYMGAGPCSRRAAM